MKYRATQIAALAATAGAPLIETPIRAQARWASDGPVVHSHYHLNVTDRAAHERFWGAVLGGVRTPWRNASAFKFPNALVLLNDRAHSGGTVGSTVNHIGFWVPNTRAMVAKIRAAGFAVITAQELPNRDVNDGVVCAEDQKTCIAYVLGPDAVKVEIVENRSQTIPIQNHHIHFHSFEVANLEAFCKRLEARGIKLDRAYSRIADLDIALAFLTDPNGTSIELTDGLRKH